MYKFLIFFIPLMLLPYSGANAQSQVDEESRSETLVSLAGVLGEMHHLRQLCAPYERPNMWRERMKELVTVEEPLPAVKSRMITSFNQAFRSAGIDYSSCEQSAIQQSRSLARKGQFYTNRLTAPFRDAVTPNFTTENGVTVYRDSQ